MGSVPHVTSLDRRLDAARARVVERGLTPQAVAQLIAVAREAPPEALAPIKQLLKRFFSDESWTAADDDALADAVGSGGTPGRHELEPGLMVLWDWDTGRFRLRVESDDPGTIADTGLSRTFDGVVQPQATPSPRTLRFATPPLHSGPSRVYDSAAATVGDKRVARIFEAFADVTNVLVGPDFVAVTISHADRWEALLEPMLDTVSEQFSDPSRDAAAAARPNEPGRQEVERTRGADRAPRRLEQAWAELGGLRANDADDLVRILAASRDVEPARRQVAAALVADAPPDVARDTWERLLTDRQRMVRRAVVDAIVDAAQQELRPLLEHALEDSDAWTRWKAITGIAALGIDASRRAVAARADDADFRVRLEATRALRDASQSG